MLAVFQEKLLTRPPQFSKASEYPIYSEDTDINTRAESRAPFSELLDFTSPLLSPRNSDFKSYGQVTFQETGPFSIFISGFREPVRAQGNTVHWHKTCFFFVVSSISEVKVFKNYSWFTICVNFYCTATSFSYTYTFKIFFSIVVYHKILSTVLYAIQ